MGAVSMMTGSSPATTVVWIRAIGVSPSSRAFSGGDQQGRRAVGDLAGVARADHAVLLERRLQRAELLQRAAGADALVGGDRAVRRASPGRSARRRHRRPGPWPPSRARRGRTRRAGCGRSPSARRSSPRRRPGSGRRRRSAPGTGGPERACRRSRRRRAEPIGTRLIDSTPPATTTSAWPLITVAAAKAHGLLGGAALPVDRRARHRLRPAGGEHRVAADVERLLADLADAAPEHVVDHGRVEPGALDQGVEHGGGEVDGWTPDNPPPRLPDRRPDGGTDDGIPHGALLLVGDSWRRRPGRMLGGGSDEPRAAGKLGGCSGHPGPARRSPSASSGSGWPWPPCCSTRPAGSWSGWPPLLLLAAGRPRRAAAAAAARPAPDGVVVRSARRAAPDCRGRGCGCGCAATPALGPASRTLELDTAAGPDDAGVLVCSAAATWAPTRRRSPGAARLDPAAGVQPGREAQTSVGRDDDQDQQGDAERAAAPTCSGAGGRVTSRTPGGRRAPATSPPRWPSSETPGRKLIDDVDRQQGEQAAQVLLGGDHEHAEGAEAGRRWPWRHRRPAGAGRRTAGSRRRRRAARPGTARRKRRRPSCRSSSEPKTSSASMFSPGASRR